MKNSKRYLSIIMIIAVMVNALLPFTVMAEVQAPEEPPVVQTTFLNEFVNGLTGWLGIDSLGPVSIFNDFINDLLGIGDVTQDGTINPNGQTMQVDNDGNVTLQPEFFQMLNDRISAAVTPVNGYFVLEDNIDFIYSKDTGFGTKLSNSSGLRVLLNIALGYLNNIVETSNYKIIANVTNGGNYCSFDFRLIKDEGYYLQSTAYVNTFSSNLNNMSCKLKSDYNSYNVQVNYDGTIKRYDSTIKNLSTEWNGVTYNRRTWTAIGVVKLFYSEAEYNNWLLNQERPYYYTPTYVPSSPVVVPNNTVNYITNNPGSTTNNNIYNYVTNETHDDNNTGQQNTDAFYQMLIDLLTNLENAINNLDNNTGGGDGKDYTEILQAILQHVQSSDDTLTDFYEFYLQHYGSGSGGSSVDTTNIEDFLEEISTNLESLLELYTNNSGNADCNYDFSELETYIDSLWLLCNENQQAIITEMEENNTFQNSIVGRLNDIYTRLAGLSDIQSTLEEILLAIESLDGSSGNLLYDTYLQDIIDLLTINNLQNDDIIDGLEDLKDKIEDQDFKIQLKNKAKQAGEKASQVFPTCIPWDLQRLVNALSAEPVTPVITVPITIESINVSEELVIDLHRFDDFASGFRVILVAVFTYGLMVFTMHFIFKNDD